MKILITPLNWGLGHTTRCIPIIQRLIENNCSVYLASDGRAGALLQKEFPDLPYFDLPAWNVQYTADNDNLGLSFLKQTPRVIHTIYKEYKAVQQIVAKHEIDIIISDNRFGCFSRKCKRNIILSHQVEVIMPKGVEFMKHLAHFSNYFCLNFFDELWIPDWNDERNISGKLSKVNTTKWKKPFYYIGQLSRFEPKQIETEFDVAVVISGPEPQRTIFEQICLKQLKKISGRSVLVLGKTDQKNETIMDGNITIKKYATKEELNELVNKSKVIVARSGYSTVMDIVKLGKHAIFVPTPQQTEQEYIAERLYEKGQYNYAEQSTFDMLQMIRETNNFTPIDLNLEQYEMDMNKAIARILSLA